MTTPPSKPRFQFGLGALFGLTVSAGVFVLVVQATRGTVFWGPLLIVLSEPKHSLWGWLMTLALAAAMASFPLKPTIATAFLAFLATLAWLFLGLLGLGIDC